MRINSTSGKVLASAAVLAAAAAVAGLGTFGSFTSTTSASQAVDSGTVEIALSPGGRTEELNLPATGLVPGDTVARAFNLSNTGDQDLSGVSLTSTATPSSKLDTDTAQGLQLKVEACSVPWTPTSTPAAYTCSGSTGIVLAERPVIGANLGVSNLASLTAGKTDHLVATMTLPATAGNSLQGQSSVINFTLTGTQRDATSQ